MNNLRERKKAAARQAMSDAATRLFEQRGFEHVTLSEIATAADVSVKTIFNYFGSKEDLFFDAEPQALENLLTALRDHPGESHTSAVRALLLEGPMLDLNCPWPVVDQHIYEALRAFHSCENESPTLRARRLVILNSWTTPLIAETNSPGWSAMLVGLLAFRHRLLVTGLVEAQPITTIENTIRAEIGTALNALDRAYPRT
ncbi:TetR/AcrR family transcriptional regulator [Kribbella sp. NPDC051620]|uniref:TetR/AcrR family transcriptional regulator n=1 Tax=Kribbella sp. NPDC051620 TaxID=3364120 RepID=UPI0037BD6B0B